MNSQWTVMKQIQFNFMKKTDSKIVTPDKPRRINP